MRGQSTNIGISTYIATIAIGKIIIARGPTAKEKNTNIANKYGFIKIATGTSKAQIILNIQIVYGVLVVICIQKIIALAILRL